MSGGGAEIDLDDAKAVGNRLLELLASFGKTESIVPGMTADWGLLVGSTLFGLTIRVVRSEGIKSS